MERGGKAFEEEGVSWVVLAAYWKEKEHYMLYMRLTLIFCVEGHRLGSEPTSWQAWLTR